jgi:hypothetical protein
MRAVGATAIITVSAPFLLGQSTNNCTGGRPFTAYRVTHIVMTNPDGTARNDEFGGLLARDSTGRVYIETSRVKMEGVKGEAQQSGEGSGTDEISKDHMPFRASISDCTTATYTTLYSGAKTARVIRNGVAASPRKNGDSLFERLTSVPRPPNIIFEDLGVKQIEGLYTHGYRETIIGTETNGAWKGKTRLVSESWISDDLQEAILKITTDVQYGTETTVMLTNIKQEEPAFSLFEIPSGYRVQPPQKQR